MTQEERDRQIGVHRTHCCLKHGCKYGRLDCPVTWKSVKQAYNCEQCEEEWEDAGSPKCCVADCDKAAYWKWGSIENIVVASIKTKSCMYFCDQHDQWLRTTSRPFNYKPIEERML